nr:immunoglobulin light chain junction region [Macaca mulatta]MPN98549.1 immunoglobulin light chain junction region [Macaca mulatta]
CQHGYGIPVTF